MPCDKDGFLDAGSIAVHAMGAAHLALEEWVNGARPAARMPGWVKAEIIQPPPPYWIELGSVRVELETNDGNSASVSGPESRLTELLAEAVGKLVEEVAIRDFRNTLSALTVRYKS